jgi:ATP adenylyltransferase
MTCLFCSIPQNPKIHICPEDEVLSETKNLYFKPALGHFVEGYGLIVSKEHFVSFAFSSQEILAELDEYSNTISAKLKDLYKLPIIMFEHGEVNEMHPAGCCIEHAHLHLMPINIDILSELNNSFEINLINSFRELTHYRSINASYIFYNSVDGQKIVFKVGRNLPCQYVRRLICNKLGIAEKWDWAIFPFNENIISFKKAFKQKSLVFN